MASVNSLPSAVSRPFSDQGTGIVDQHIDPPFIAQQGVGEISDLLQAGEIGNIGLQVVIPGRSGDLPAGDVELGL